jgi:hypothetical protein
MTQVKTNNAPQQQYRILRSNETVQQGDEFRVGSIWIDCRSTIGKTVQQNVDAVPQTFDIVSFRRKLPILPGYRYLEENEVIQEGDEYNSLNNWRPIIVSGSPLSRGDVGYFRRKLEVKEAPEPMVDPGEGYRLLADDEVIQKGDECWCSSCEAWETTGCSGNMPKIYNRAYRRKLEQIQSPTDTKPSTDDDGFVRVQTKGGSFMMKLYPTFFRQRVKICSTPDNDSFEWETEDAEAHSDTDFGTLDQCMQDIRNAGFTGRVEIVSKAFDK